MNDLLRDVQSLLGKEECAGGMGLSVNQLCSTEGFTNQSKLGVGGESIRHGSKEARKRCSSEDVRIIVKA